MGAIGGIDSHPEVCASATAPALYPEFHGGQWTEAAVVLR